MSNRFFFSLLQTIYFIIFGLIFGFTFGHAMQNTLETKLREKNDEKLPKSLRNQRAHTFFLREKKLSDRILDLMFSIFNFEYFCFCFCSVLSKRTEIETIRISHFWSELIFNVSNEIKPSF